MTQTKFMLRVQQYQWSSIVCAGKLVIRRLLHAILLHELARESAVPAWDKQEVNPEASQKKAHT